jgi:hypothetical protein
MGIGGGGGGSNFLGPLVKEGGSYGFISSQAFVSRLKICGGSDGLTKSAAYGASSWMTFTEEDVFSALGKKDKLMWNNDCAIAERKSHQSNH